MSGPHSDPTSGPAPATVLVAEDDRITADIIRFSLVRRGLVPVVAGDGEVAWERLQEATPAVLVTDHQMPRLSGLSLIERVRADDRFAALPILFCSAKGLELDLDYLQGPLRVRQVFFKPFSPRGLVQAVEEALSSVDALKR